MSKITVSDELRNLEKDCTAVQCPMCGNGLLAAHEILEYHDAYFYETDNLIKVLEEYIEFLTKKNK
jgi:hypothetical protein